MIQLNARHTTWTRTDWAQTFDSLRTLGLKQIVVQWTVSGDTAYYATSRRYRPVPMPPLEAILDLADGAGMRVLVGLAHDPDYWEELKRDDVQVATYLPGLRMSSLGAARELTPFVVRHRAFEGWYLSEEIDVLTWHEPARRALLLAHLNELTTTLRALAPKARIAVSGFVNSGTDAAAFKQFWNQLFAATPELGIVLFQDGIGVGKLSLEELPVYLAAIKHAADNHGRELRVIVEMFRQTAGAPIDVRAFAAEPAALDRIRRQLKVARGFTAHTLAFSAPDYIGVGGPPAAVRLFEQYRNACVASEC